MSALVMFWLGAAALVVTRPALSRDREVLESGYG